MAKEVMVVIPGTPSPLFLWKSLQSRREGRSERHIISMNQVGKLLMNTQDSAMENSTHRKGQITVFLSSFFFHIMEEDESFCGDENSGEISLAETVTEIAF